MLKKHFVFSFIFTIFTLFLVYSLADFVHAGSGLSAPQKVMSTYFEISENPIESKTFATKNDYIVIPFFDSGNNNYKLKKITYSVDLLGNLVYTVTDLNNSIVFTNPADIEIDDNDNIYVTDSANGRISKINSTGTLLASWGNLGSGTGAYFSELFGITISVNNEIYVTDKIQRKVKQFDITGSYQTEWEIPGGVYACPTDIANYGGDLYIIDSCQKRIIKRTAEGRTTYISKYGFNNEYKFKNIKGIDIDAFGKIYVGDSGNQDVVVFNTNLMTKEVLGIHNADTVLGLNPNDVIVGTDFHIYVLEDNVVKRFDAYGNSKGSFGSIIVENTFELPSSIAVEIDGDYWVTDKIPNTTFERIRLFSKNGIYKGITIETTSTAIIALTIDRLTGNLLAADFDLMNVKRYDRTNGSLLNTYSLLQPGFPAAPVMRPNDIATDYDGNMIVSSGNSMEFGVGVYNSNGDYIRNFPRVWLARAAGVGADIFGNYYVLEDIENTYDSLIKKYDVNGTLVATWTSFNGKNFDTLFDMVVEADKIYLISASATIVLDTNGNFLYEQPASCSFGENEINIGNGTEIYMSCRHSDYINKVSIGYNIDILNNAYALSIESGERLAGTGAAYINDSDVQIMIFDQNNFPIAMTSVNLTESRDWSNVEVGKDIAAGKAFISNLNPIDAPGAATEHSLFIPILDQLNNIYICPDAESISEIYLGCVGGYTLVAKNNPNVRIQYFNGLNYWVVDGLTGTGGMNLSQNPVNFVMTPNFSQTSETKEVIMTYDMQYPLAEGDKVQFVFEEVAGFVLGTNCAVPTIDANSDSITDGSASIIGLNNNIYEYTVDTVLNNGIPSGTVTFCVNVTAPATASSYSVRLTDDNGSFGTQLYIVGGDGDVFVIANVMPSLSFNIRTIDDLADTNVCDFGTITTSDPIPAWNSSWPDGSVCSYMLAVGTNASGGYVININSDGPLRNTSGDEIADIVNGSPFVPGVEAYGIVYLDVPITGRDPISGLYEEFTYVGNKDLGNPFYAYNWLTWDVGTAIPTTPTLIFNYDKPIYYYAGENSIPWNQAIDTHLVTHGLVIGAGTPAGSYSQVITYTVVPNF